MGMTRLVHERFLELMDGQGTAYHRALVYADRQPAGNWVAWVEFVSDRGDQALQTDRETTQSTLNGVAYWATGLQPTYFEGALDRAYRHTLGTRSRPPTPPPTSSGLVAFRVRSADAAVAFRLMPARTLVPGDRRELHDGAAIIYVRAVQPPLADMPRTYEFLAQFRSLTAAGTLARQIEADLKDTEARLEVRRVEVPIESAAIRNALLA